MSEGYGLAIEGRGCNFCTEGVPIVQVQSPMGVAKLCLSCVLRWWPQHDAAWFEERHAPFRNHLDDKLKAAIKKQLVRPVHEPR